MPLNATRSHFLFWGLFLRVYGWPHKHLPPHVYIESRKNFCATKRCHEACKSFSTYLIGAKPPYNETHIILFTSDLLLHLPFLQDSNHGYRKRVRGHDLSFHDIERFLRNKTSV
ncbi:hypothetical protein PF008_g13789 [Phytophthora fragariae]|uniref:Uncharacterized protein n=1 Tax=Phytophthora fragariae TaxID=53985 RepID=A0A6G0RIW2_9STRA|nr:hypothetical protein PF008_g13789 [Phytophthora fragariae]